MNLLQQCPEQCCLAGTVFADKTYAASWMDCPTDIIEDSFVQKRKTDIAEINQ
jgi:hypothetical protein